jgi:predicted Rossmann fold flavoprotein
MKKVLIVGGGAAGFFCAIQVAGAHPDWEVSIVEKTSKILSKVKVSGGGRCNVTHDCKNVPHLLTKYPRGKNFLKKAFYQFATQQTIDWYASHGVDLHVEADGRMFPVSNNSETIIQCLLKEVNRLGINILLNHEVVAVKNKFDVTFRDGKQMHVDAICLAIGGLLRSDSISWIESLGHHIIKPVPSLFTFNIDKQTKSSIKEIVSLMGVAVNDATVQWKGEKTSERGPVLITHWGISGPAAIKLSAWNARELAEKEYVGELIINWLPDENETSLRSLLLAYRNEFGKKEVAQKNPFGLPNRLWEFLMQQADLTTGTTWANVPAKSMNQLIQLLVRTILPIRGKTTFKEEFVTCGGVDINDINPQTMESKLVPGLHFAGEMMDVDGITGGFNFQHAWTSGWLAAQHIANQQLAD